VFLHVVCLLQGALLVVDLRLLRFLLLVSFLVSD
jgi:hypothetical protein